MVYREGFELRAMRGFLVCRLAIGVCAAEQVPVLTGLPFGFQFRLSFLLCELGLSLPQLRDQHRFHQESAYYYHASLLQAIDRIKPI